MHRARILAPLVATALVLAACGGDDDTDTATVDTEEETETAAGSDVDEEALAGTMGECGFLAGFATAFEDFDPTTMYSGEEATDFGAIFTPLAEATQEVADAAPDEIRDAFRTLADGFSAVAEELEGVVLDLTDPEGMDPETMAKLEGLDTAFGAEFEAASTEIDAWISENCADFAERLDLDRLGT